MIRPTLTNTLKQARRLRTSLTQYNDLVIGEKNGIKVLDGAGRSCRTTGISCSSTEGMLSLKNGEPFKQVVKNAETGQTTVYNFETGDMIEISHVGDLLNKTKTNMATGEQKHLTMLFDKTTKKPVCKLTHGLRIFNS